MKTCKTIKNKQQNDQQQQQKRKQKQLVIENPPRGWVVVGGWKSKGKGLKQQDHVEHLAKGVHVGQPININIGNKGNNNNELQLHKQQGREREHNSIWRIAMAK